METASEIVPIFLSFTLFLAGIFIKLQDKKTQVFFKIVLVVPTLLSMLNFVMPKFFGKKSVYTLFWELIISHEFIFSGILLIIAALPILVAMILRRKASNVGHVTERIWEYLIGNFFGAMAGVACLFLLCIVTRHNGNEFNLLRIPSLETIVFEIAVLVVYFDTVGKYKPSEDHFDYLLNNIWLIVVTFLALNSLIYIVSSAIYAQKVLNPIKFNILYTILFSVPFVYFYIMGMINKTDSNI